MVGQRGFEPHDGPKKIFVFIESGYRAKQVVAHDYIIIRSQIGLGLDSTLQFVPKANFFSTFFTMGCTDEITAHKAWREPKEIKLVSYSS